MTTFSGIMDPNYLPFCCMKKNYTPIEEFNEYVYVLGITSAIYLASYLVGFNTICIGSTIVMNFITFKAGMKYHQVYINQENTNNELDTSSEGENELYTSSEDDTVDRLSQKQREQGANIPSPISESQEEYVIEQLNKIVEATQLRNRGRRYAYTPPSPPLCKNSPSSPPLTTPPSPPLTTNFPYYDEVPVEHSVPRFSNSHYLSSLDDYD